MSLNLAPNEIVGYRIKPDWYSFNVVLVKRHGPNSKSAGQEYDTTLAYCKNLNFAANWILSHALRMEGELNQKDAERVQGSVADAKAILAAFEKAETHVNRAVAELQARLDGLALTQSALVQRLGSAEPVLSEA